MQLAIARTEIALHAAIFQPMPILGRNDDGSVRGILLRRFDANTIKAADNGSDSIRDVDSGGRSSWRAEVTQDTRTGGSFAPPAQFKIGER